jgi:Ni/Fe-hydrogenase subunit HybB-like protein
MNEFIFPNDARPPWSLMIVVYPYITGLVAGAFVVSSLYHVFGAKALRPVARLSLVSATAFCCIAGLPLQLHLHHPENSYLIFVTPSPSSAMFMFGAIYNAYLLLLFVELWFVYRELIVERSKAPGLKGMIYKVLSLGSTQITEASREVDHRIITALSFIGIPAACALHGYVGFIFGAVKANPWWSTSLTPVIFLLSAVVSGIAAQILLYQFIAWRRGIKADLDCVRTMATYLWGFLFITLAIEQLQLWHKAYESSSSWPILEKMLEGKLHFSHHWLQLVIGALVPFFLLPLTMWKGLSSKLVHGLAALCSVLVLVQVLSMRWNVVMGGQMFSKSLRGFVDVHVELLGKEGIMMGAVVLLLPLLLIWIATFFLPLKLQEHEPG